MKATETDLKALIPQFMRNDKEWRGLCDGVSEVFKDIADGMPKMSVWDALDSFTDAELDAMAEEIRCLWYKKDFSKEKKREILRTADSALKTLGTVYAVEEVVGKYFDGTAQVIEWFDYNGRPHHFEIETTSANILNGSTMTEFYRILDIVKRKSQWLEKIIIKLAAETEKDGATVGVFLSECNKETYRV